MTAPYCFTFVFFAIVFAFINDTATQLARSFNSNTKMLLENKASNNLTSPKPIAAPKCWLK